MRQTVEWGAGEYTPHLERAREELRREIAMCDRAAAEGGEVGQRFRWYADLARETLERVERELDENYATLDHARLRLFRLICDGSELIADPVALHRFLRSRAGLRRLEARLRRRGLLTASLEEGLDVEVQAESWWKTLLAIDPCYQRLPTESVQEIKQRSPWWWLDPPRNPETYVFVVFRQKATVHAATHGTRGLLGALDLDQFEVNWRDAGRLAREGWKHLERTEGLRPDDLVTHDSPEGSEVILLKRLELEAHSDQVRRYIWLLARGLSVTDAAQEAGLSRSMVRAFERRARRNIQL